VTLHPYEHYAEIGDTAAYAKWNSRMKFFVAGFAIVAGLIALAASGQVGLAVFGAFAGGALGYGIFRWTVYASSASTADDLFRTDWCTERGMQDLGEYYPGNAPYATSGDERKAKDAYEGTWNGLDTLFYNFTYTDKRDSDDPDTDYDFKIMRLKGRDLPIRRLTIHQRSALNKFKWVDNLQGKFTKEKPISLESVAFNEKFDLTIDDAADEIWIRRIFDPATIQSLVDGQFTIPDVQFYDHCWWFVEREHFKIRDLDEWVPKQKLAAEAVEHLSRVQTL
jgi:hypothetical protein